MRELKDLRIEKKMTQQQVADLFGSYAKGKETSVSDVDLLISVNVRGITVDL